MPSTVTRGFGWSPSRCSCVLRAVVTARVFYRLPDCWSSMSIDHRPGSIAYRSAHRWPGPGRGPATCDVDVSIGERFTAAQLTDLDHWLIARWRLSSAGPRGLRYALAEHAPWELFHAEVSALDESLMIAADLGPPDGDPLVHWSPGVEVRIGVPRRVGRTGR